VGQGDAVLLSYAQTQILIDTGPSEKVLACLEKHLPFWDKKIDVLVITHFDADHIGGFQQIAQIYEINHLFLSLTEVKDSQLFLELREQALALQGSGTSLKQPFLGQQIAFSQISSGNQTNYNSTPALTLSFLTPFELDLEEYHFLLEQGSFLWQKPENYLSDEAWQKMATKNNDNNGSIALLAVFGELKLLLLGDLESPREVALTSLGLITDIDIQKIGHHGSKTASSIDFLWQSRPEMSLISCGQNNKFDHPHQEVLANLQAISSQVKRTDQLGDIEIISDGVHFWLKEPKTNIF
jgi:competence protein ComEC